MATTMKNLPTSLELLFQTFNDVKNRMLLTFAQIVEVESGSVFQPHHVVE